MHGFALTHTFDLNLHPGLVPGLVYGKREEKGQRIHFATNILHEYRMRPFVQNLQNMLWIHSELGWFEDDTGCF